MNGASKVWIVCVLGLVLLSLPTATSAGWALSRAGDPQRFWNADVSVASGYDDNVFTSTTGKKGSFTTSITPRLSATVPMEKTSLSLRYSYAAAYYANRSNNQIDQSHSADLTLSHRFTSRLELSLANSFRFGIEPELVELTTGVPIISRRRGDFYYDSVTGRLSYELSRRWSLAINGAWDIWRFNEQTVARDNDREDYSGTVGFTYAFSQRTFAGVNYAYRATDYTQPTPGNTRDLKTHDGYVSFAHRFNPKLSVRGYGGFGLTEFGDGTQQTAPNAGASLAYNYGPEDSVSAGFSYSLSTTEVSTFRSSDTASFYAQVAHRFTWKFRASANAAYILYSYQNPSPFAGPLLQKNVSEDAIQFGLGLVYSFYPWLSATANYTYDQVSSDIGGRSYDRNRATMGLQLKY